MGSWRVGHDCATKQQVDLTNGIKLWGEGNGNPLQYPCLENFIDREGWWSAVHGIAESAMTEWLIHTHIKYHRDLGRDLR